LYFVVPVVFVVVENEFLTLERDPVRLAQGYEQFLQPVMVDLVHQRQQFAQLPGRESFAGKPVQIVAGQIGDRAALVLAEWHGDGNESRERR